MNQPDLHISFQHKGVNYPLTLVQGGKSEQSIRINGVSYAILGDHVILETAFKTLKSLPLCDIHSLDDLAERLSKCKDPSCAPPQKSAYIGMKALNTPFIEAQLEDSESKSKELNSGAWMKKNNSKLHKKQEIIAQKYWNSYISIDAQKNHSELIGFLKSVPNSKTGLEELFLKSIDMPKDFNLFLSLFRHLSEDDLYAINKEENLNSNLSVQLTDRSVKITNAFLKDLKHYMQDINFSGVVTLSDENDKHYTVTVDGTKDTIPFSIHSVGKMFTGALMLRLIEEDVITEESLKKFIQLDEDVIIPLSDAVREQLSKTTLHEVMIHHGRYGNYLGSYLDAIKKALEKKSDVPKISHPKDFLQYADKELIPLDKLDSSGFSYSNLGSLLVGLSIEHMYNLNKSAEEKLSYAEILNQYVIIPAGIKSFQLTKPETARFNKEDPLAPHISGGPAGGYWCTARDLLQFGRWLGKKSKEENFMRLLDKYGGEFYMHRDIAHGGSIETASAHLSHRIDNGLTIAVMSDMKGLGAASKLAQMIQEHLLGSAA